MAQEFDGDAIFSRSGKNRYVLRYRWAKGPLLVWFMLNPSTANEGKSDPTITRCINFSKANGYGGLIVVNSEPLVSTDSKGIRGVLSPTADLYNRRFIRQVARRHTTVVAAWGGFCKRSAVSMRKELRDFGFTHVLCLGTTKAGQPKHPLYLNSKTELRPWKIS